MKLINSGQQQRRDSDTVDSAFVSS